MKPRACDVELAVVGWHDAACALDHVAIANGSVTHVGVAGLDCEVRRSDDEGLAVDDREDLAATGVDDRSRPGCTRGQCVQSGDAGETDGQGEGERAPGRQSHPQAREAARPGSDDDPFELRVPHAAAPEQRVEILEYGGRAAGQLAEGRAVPDERARRNVRGRVEREDQHSTTSMRRRSSPACSSDKRKRAGGSTPSPASGHSTKQTAPSKYGSRSPHSAGETPAKRYRSRWDTSTCPRSRWRV